MSTFRSETAWFEKKSEQTFSQALGAFVTRTQFKDLPESVIHETKRIILDCIACAVAGTRCDKGKISIGLSKRLGDSPESSIIGTSHKVSCCSAAFAHGELISALDYDAFEIPQGHIPPCLIPPPLAVAESIGASGKDLILATALGCEVECRIHHGLTPRTEVLGAEKGKTRLAFGESQYVFGGAAGVGKILGLNPEEIAHALGIAVHFCPVPVGRKFQVTESPSAMTKYGESGWPSMAGVTAALLAEGGYAGDLEAFDGDFGFWRMYSYGQWEPEKAIDQIGERWLFLGIGFKPYPCHRTMHGPLDAFFSILHDNNLTAAEIESVRILGNPKVMNQRHGQHIENHVAAQFNVPYIFSCAAHGIKPGPAWQTPDTLRNENILAFREKVSSEGLPDWNERVGDDPRKRWGGAVEVMARGRLYKEDRIYAKGTAFTDAEMTDEELEEKLRSSAEGVLPEKKVKRAIALLSSLEDLEDVRELMRQVTL